MWVLPIINKQTTAHAQNEVGRVAPYYPPFSHFCLSKKDKK